MKILVIIFVLFILNGCGVYTDVNYRLKNVEQGYKWNKRGTIDLTEDRVQGENKIGGIYLDIEITKFPKYKYDILIIKSAKSSSYINGKIVFSKEVKYRYVELPNGVEITKKNGKKIKVEQDKIKYSYKENPNTNFKEAIVYLPEKLSGPIMIELGKIKICGEEYNTPKIYMQKYKEKESWSLIGSILSTDANEIGPLYHSENWIDD